MIDTSIEFSSINLNGQPRFAKRRPYLLELWVLADKLIIPNLKDEAQVCLSDIDRKLHKDNDGHGTRYSSEDLTYIYDNTTSGSSLRASCIRAHLISKDDPATIKPEDYPFDFWTTVALFSMGRLSLHVYDEIISEAIGLDCFVGKQQINNGDDDGCC